MAGNRLVEEVRDFASSRREAVYNVPTLMHLIKAAINIDKLI